MIFREHWECDFFRLANVDTENYCVRVLIDANEYVKVDSSPRQEVFLELIVLLYVSLDNRGIQVANIIDIVSQRIIRFDDLFCHVDLFSTQPTVLGGEATQGFKDVVV